MNILNKTISIFSKLIPFKLVSKKTSPILLYHSIFKKPPSHIVNGLDNVTPDILYKQLSKLKRFYKIIALDDLIRLDDRRGYTSITFDDGYKKVLSNGLKVFESLNIPITIFLNTSTLERKIFWRDKIRFLINNNLIKEFENYTTKIKKIRDLEFYAYTKNKANNSILVESEIDNFLKYKEIEINDLNYCFNSEAQLIDHPLISYGNHSHNHFVMSSLSYEEQFHEINYPIEIFKKIGLNHSKVFSLPFGRFDDYNSETLKLLSNAGYEGVLLSENKLNYSSQDKNIINGIELLNRFMPMKKPISFSIKNIYLRNRLLN